MLPPARIVGYRRQPGTAEWVAYCETCHAFRDVRRAQARDAGDFSEYFEFVCNTCHSILLTFQRMNPAERCSCHELLNTKAIGVIARAAARTGPSPECAAGRNVDVGDKDGALTAPVPEILQA
jgi:hypothetical protein